MFAYVLFCLLAESRQLFFFVCFFFTPKKLLEEKKKNLGKEEGEKADANASGLQEWWLSRHF